MGNDLRLQAFSGAFSQPVGCLADWLHGACYLDQAHLRGSVSHCQSHVQPCAGPAVSPRRLMQYAENVGTGQLQLLQKAISHEVARVAESEYFRMLKSFAE